MIGDEMIRVGVIGIGFMGTMHSKTYQNHAGAKLAAICDIDPVKLTGKAGVAGNIAGAEDPIEMDGVETYADFDEMLAGANLDAVSITLPTYLHKEYTIKALNAGVNVMCEKPMALNLTECDEMMAAAEKAGKRLQIGHCLRFWPEYTKAKEIIDSGEYGKIRSVTFTRIAQTPTWSWDNWLMDGNKSGGAMLDLHIHDSDLVQFFFGMPKAVYTTAVKGPSNDYDQMVTHYDIGQKDVSIVAEGGWMMAPDFGFQMSFNIVMEKASMSFDCTREGGLKVYPAEGGTVNPKVAEGDGYLIELDHFVRQVAGEKLDEVITQQGSKNAVEIITAERKSADTNEKVNL